MNARWILPLLCAAPLLASGQTRTNVFDEPFVHVTAAMAACPEPRPPGYTPEEVRKEEHVRAQHGTSCYYSGRCRLAELLPV